MYGRKHSEETKKKMSLARLKNPTRRKWTIQQRKEVSGRYLGEKNPNWRGGKYKEKYSYIFNQQLKDIIRTQYNFICQMCGKPELECKKRLSIHHIDYDKQNNNTKNLIPLCTKCHMKTNKKIDKAYWINFFTNKVVIK